MLKGLVFHSILEADQIAATVKNVCKTMVDSRKNNSKLNISPNLGRVFNLSDIPK